MNARFNLVFTSLALAACSACGAGDVVSEPAPQVRAPQPPEPVSYEVHEWGLVRGTQLDGVMLSGPHVDEIMMPMAKPVLYFHRTGAGPLSVSVDVRISNGRVVEHWPIGDVDGEGAHLSWSDVVVEEEDCAGSSYPTEADPPCDSIEAPDACEAATLAIVETDDGACLRHRGEAFDNLFYRGEIRGAPSLPLSVAREGTVLRVAHGGTEAVFGSVVRVQRSTHQVSVVRAPAPGSSVSIPAPSSAGQVGADALAESLRAAGLTEPEVLAFRRAWDEQLFGGLVAAGETLPTATPMAVAADVASDDAILYVLPQATADALAPLTFNPEPTALRRAIVAWIDADAGAPARF